ncbi:PREDICTED: CASP-like protein 4A2 [Tarenaya hassleriana]|uniref:CASP-like protein 4A2 n=1 Tax=Tarenaya hassleriana TaxID=28532 RepID=UPI00053C2656|nr:PREDICTED: CASP-like protein 4A2 [Tarenaya hassleriana]
MKRTSSSNSEVPSHLDSPHSPLRFHSPLRSDALDPPESRYASPEGSPFKLDNPKAIIASEKFTQFCPLPSPIPPPPPPPQRNVGASAKSPSSMVVFNRWVREDAPQSTTRKVGPPSNGVEATAVRRTRREELVGVAALGFRLSEVVLSLISFSIMAADKTQGWSGDSYDRYKEYRYCLGVNVTAFVYSAFQACDAACYMAREKYMINYGLHNALEFFMDQVLAYLLISASSSAATRVDDWVSNWGKDEFTQMATASIVMSFLTFTAFAFSSMISAYKLFTHGSS